MAHGDGMVRKYETEAGDRWSLTYSYKDRTGKYKTKKVSGLKTEAEAKALARKVRQEKHDEKFLVPDRKTFQEYVETEYLPHVRRKGRAAITLKNYEAALTRWVFPSIGQVQVQRLTWKDVQGLVDDLSGLSQGTVSLCLTLTSMALDLAKGDGLVAENVAQHPRIVRPKQPKSERKPWTMEEAQQFIASLKPDHDDMELAFLLMMLTGIRRGEAAGLVWDDIDLDAGTLLVSRSVSSVDGVLHVSEGGKTVNARRMVALVPALTELLTRHKNRSREALWAQGKPFGGASPVFGTWFGKPRSPHTFSTRFQQAVKRAKVRPMPLHGLRHLHITEAQMVDGISQTMIGLVVGHASVTTTRGYTHASQEAAQKVASAVADRLLG